MKTAAPSLHRVLVIDDQLLVRAGVTALLQDLPGFQCVGSATDATSGLRACLQLRPDLVLLDLHLPSTPTLDTGSPAGAPQPPDAVPLAPVPDTLQGLALARALQAEIPSLRVIVLSGHTEPTAVRAALRAGVAGFIAKDFVLEDLSLALRSVAEGRRWLSPSVASALQASERAPRLTPRQRDVLRCIARGRSNKEIARDLGISVKTVEYHRTELIQRLDIHDVASLTRFAIAHGVLA